MSEPEHRQTPLRTAEAVDYQSDAIVSRTIVKSSGGSVTLFAFDAGQSLSEHTVPFNAFVAVVDGAAEIRIGQDDHRVLSGQSILLPANVPHAVNAVDRFKMMLCMIRE